MKPVGVRALGDNYAKALAHVASTGKALPVTKQNKDYVSVVPTEFVRALQELAEQGGDDELRELVRDTIGHATRSGDTAAC